MKIPENAELKFKGIIFDVYQWQQEMFDGSFETFEGLKRHDTVVVIPVFENNLIINEEIQPLMDKFNSFPCGRVDEGETPLKTAKRELLEETGYSSDEWIEYTTMKPDRKIEWTVHVFIAKNCNKIQEQKLDAGEKINTKLIKIDEFKEFFNSENFRGKELAFIISKDEDFLNKLK